ncbi:MAG: Crp/Fnr family transcriptional regulator [Cyclobacteriaceae bacterium]
MNSTIPPFLVEFNSAVNRLELAFCDEVMRQNDKDHFGSVSASIASFYQFEMIMVDRKILEKYGAVAIHPKKGEVIFNQGSEALFYYQVADGAIKMVTNNANGQEFIQGIFSADESFGEPPLFCEFPYPSTAIAMDDAEVIKLTKQHFMELLRDNFEIHLKFDRVLCNRLKYKSMILSDISFKDPERRIGNLLQYFKGFSQSDYGTLKKKNFIVPYTRQQIADMSGLRVETVIRTVKKMERDGKLEIVGRKIRI